MFRGLSEGDYIMPDNSNLRLRQQIDEIKKYRLDCELEIKNKVNFNEIEKYLVLV